MPILDESYPLLVHNTCLLMYRMLITWRHSVHQPLFQPACLGLGKLQDFQHNHQSAVLVGNNFEIDIKTGWHIPFYTPFYLKNGWNTTAFHMAGSKILPSSTQQRERVHIGLNYFIPLIKSLVGKLGSVSLGDSHNAHSGAWSLDAGLVRLWDEALGYWRIKM
eukprot:1148549-Pelagomonas_calceolata.AAC.1